MEKSMQNMLSMMLPRLLRRCPCVLADLEEVAMPPIAVCSVGGACLLWSVYGLHRVNISEDRLEMTRVSEAARILQWQLLVCSMCYCRSAMNAFLTSMRAQYFIWPLKCTSAWSCAEERT